MEIIYVDAFARKPFCGNPAAVCILPEDIDDLLKQNIALEINFSETAFLFPFKSGYRLRWFTPKNEVDLCGHATLASAHVLWEKEIVSKSEKIDFYTNSGLLIAEFKDNYIIMDFPSTPPAECSLPQELANALGVPIKYSGKSQFDYIVEIESEEVLREISPDFSLLQKVDTRGVIVTAKSMDRKYDFISRFFAPGAGVNEDPVTGSAHCCLGPYWEKKMNKSEFHAYQASPRGGELSVNVMEDRCVLIGECISIMKADLLLQI